jgi:hypothetical protein
VLIPELFEYFSFLSGEWCLRLFFIADLLRFCPHSAPEMRGRDNKYGMLLEEEQVKLPRGDRCKVQIIEANGSTI